MGEPTVHDASTILRQALGDALGDDRLDDVAAPCEVVTASPGDHLKVHTVQQPRKRTNRYVVFSERPIGLEVDDLAAVRQEMWASFGTDSDA